MIKGLYAIADSGFVTEDILPQFASDVLKGGCKLIQLRMKISSAMQQYSYSAIELTRYAQHNTYDERRTTNDERRTTSEGIRRVAQEIMNLKKKYEFTFIINDHSDIALDVGADGVHVGENDEPVSLIRKRAGDKLIIGYSSHSVEEAKRAEKDGADYVAFGAIFSTKTKGPGHPVQGLKRLTEVVKSLHVPVVAIGGMGRNNVIQTLETKVSSIAMISALAEAEDVVVETEWFVKTIEEQRSAFSKIL